MREWYQEQLQRMADHHSSDEELYGEITSSAKALSFDFWMFGIRLPIPVTRPATEVRGNYPPSWQSRYRTPGYVEIDPILRHCKVSSVPLIWTAEAPSSERQYWDDAKAHGIRYGWSISLRDRFSAVTWFTLARNSSPIYPDELAVTEYPMTWLAHFAHASLGARLLPTMFAGSMPHLSPREREVMGWTAEGKTAAEIGVILGIAESTCIFHLTNATRKLGAVNKTHAAAKAAVLGLIG
ncbi:MAG: autoinducer binding domain-containing protein [Paraburkholderia sp.]|jgi:DNA-binding CsgD family transcriptional regulator|uniref:autoinducer binding domain-containing protein n=1 Tax=Burkholderiaceae TaxID=119060 RepID=UPI0010F9B561|nr:autoinducer binding domain-containing protein [Burkholderia sp. 4M9327F10]